MKKNYRILIPAYNSERYIDDLFDRLEKAGLLDKAVVVNDGSTDDTLKICENRGIKALSNKKNKGKGSALKKGFKYMSDNDVEFFITLDSDLQHDVKYIPEFLKRYEKTGADIIVGNRLGDTTTMPVERVFSNRTTSYIVSLLAKQKIPDSQSGYRLIRTETVRDIVLNCDKFEMESELLIKAGRKGFRIESVPISALYEGAHSSISIFRDTYRFIRLVVRSFLVKN
ncbi:MAG: glycosyltransferase family 2 protein [Candidatus Delongbacteria bacterium]